MSSLNHVQNQAFPMMLEREHATERRVASEAAPHLKNW